jgi:hypothetical protein
MMKVKESSQTDEKNNYLTKITRFYIFRFFLKRNNIEKKRRRRKTNRESVSIEKNNQINSTDLSKLSYSIQVKDFQLY